MPRTERGTVAVLLADFLAAMAVMTGGLLYTKIAPAYLLLLVGLTFGLFFVVWLLLALSNKATRSANNRQFHAS